MSAETKPEIKPTMDHLSDPYVLQLIEALARRDDEIERLRAERKNDCVEFFRWWWNQPGTNTEKGYDAWCAEKVIDEC